MQITKNNGKNTELKKNDTNLEIINLSEVSIYLHNWVMPLIVLISFLDSPVNLKYLQSLKRINIRFSGENKG